MCVRQSFTTKEFRADTSQQWLLPRHWVHATSLLRVSSSASRPSQEVFPTPQLCVLCVNAEDATDDALPPIMPIASHTHCQRDALRSSTIDISQSISAGLAGKTAFLRQRALSVTSALVLVPTGTAHPGF